MVFLILFNKTLLHLAVEMNHINIVKLLLNHKDIDVNIRTVFGLSKNLMKF